MKYYYEIIREEWVSREIMKCEDFLAVRKIDASGNPVGWFKVGCNFRPGSETKVYLSGTDTDIFFPAMYSLRKTLARAVREYELYYERWRR